MLVSRVLLLASVALAACVSLVHGAIDADLIDQLPGYGPTGSKQYSGVIPVDNAKTAYLHYWFVTAINADPTTAPVTVWLNGGPGCSSLDGFLYENGPYKFTGKLDGNGVPMLRDNPLSWATVSNMLYIESPFGVGYSYATNGSTTNNDDTTSQNLYGFLLNFFAGFKEFSSNEFYITGESYAGFYVPQFALRIHEGNAAGNPKVNLIGFAIGNACVGEGGSCGSDTSDRTMVNFFYGHAMIAQPDYETVIARCGPYINVSGSACSQAVDQATNNIGNIWIYDVYDICGNEVVLPSSSVAAAESSRFSRLRALNPLLESLNIGDPVPCTELDSSLGDKYMNHEMVKQALHVDSIKVAAPWSVCANVDYTRDTVSLIPTYQSVLIDNYRVLVFNGDADACVPWNGSEEWTRMLGRPIKNDWHPYMITDQYIGGFATEYDTKNGFAFLTAKHAGHMVPQYEPEIALYIFEHFLSGKGY